MSGLQNFIGNYAQQQGGALALFGDSKMTLVSPLLVNFSKNKAGTNGGAIFFTDPISTSYCNQTDERFELGYCKSPTEIILVPCKKLTSCFLELKVDTHVSSNDSLVLKFIENSAGEAGSVLYGGQLDYCKLFIESGNEIRYDDSPIECFRNISYIENDDNITAEIASDPVLICFCNDEVPNCMAERSAQTMTGRTFSLSLVTVGQGNFTVLSSVRVGLDSHFQLDPVQNIQTIGKVCSNVTYSLFSSQTSAKLILYPDGPC